MLQKLQQLEDIFDYDEGEYPTHTKGDESMSPITLTQIFTLKDVKASGLTQKIVRTRLARKMLIQDSKIIEEHKPEYFKKGFYKVEITKKGLLYYGTASSGLIYAKGYPKDDSPANL